VTTPWLTIEEAMKYLRMTSRSYLNWLAKSGKVKAVRPKGFRTYRFRQEWLDAFLYGKP
jgi:excisionase family DNA binding protein